MEPITMGIMAASALSSLFGQKSAKKTANADRAESKRQFDLRYGLDQAANARTQQDFDAKRASRSATDPARAAIAQALFKKLMGGAAMPGAAAPPMGGAPAGGMPMPTPGMGSGGLPAGGGGGMDMIQAMVRRFA